MALGTCDKLLSELEQELDAFCIILDFKRVHTIDLTGAQLIKELLSRLQEHGGMLAISYLDVPGDPEKARMSSILKDVSVVGEGAAQVFFDTDHAQEWAEDALIEHEDELTRFRRTRLAVEHLNAFQGLTEEQVGLVSRYLHPQRFEQGDIVFREGDPGDRIYFILSGHVSVLAATVDVEVGPDRPGAVASLAYLAAAGIGVTGRRVLSIEGS